MERDPLALFLESLPWRDWGSDFHTLVYTCVEILALIFAIEAIRKARNSQTAIAWSLSLITMPFISSIFYIAFGRSKFLGMANFRRRSGEEVFPFLSELHKSTISEDIMVADEDLCDEDKAFHNLATLSWLKGNKTQLLINGEATFDAIFKAIDEARDYILIQFFIVNDDQLGNLFKEKIKAASSRGVQVYLIPDGIGSYSVDEVFWDEIRASGVHVELFRVVERRSRRFQLNFRNHRKIVVIDGKTAFFGGHNVGDEYLGRDPALSPWRDTHCQVWGPIISSFQISFLEDWYFVKGLKDRSQLPKLFWGQDSYSEENTTALMIPSGPADLMETCGLMFNQAILMAKKRFWIASPYFIPDGKITAALTLAALKGVDVRVLLPSKPDHLMVYMARKDFYDELQSAGVKFYHYQKGFLHQKVFIIDDRYGSVGTANLDNRSFRLNFELTVLFKGERMIKDLEEMLIQDMEDSILIPRYNLDERSLWEQIMVKVCRLFSPIL